MDRTILFPEGVGGFMPNLDLVNVITRTSYWQGIKAGINPHALEEPVDGTLPGLLLFNWNNAVAAPRSNHAYFSRWRVHSVGVSTAGATELHSHHHHHRHHASSSSDDSYDDDDDDRRLSLDLSSLLKQVPLAPLGMKQYHYHYHYHYNQQQQQQQHNNNNNNNKQQQQQQQQQKPLTTTTTTTTTTTSASNNDNTTSTGVQQVVQVVDVEEDAELRKRNVTMMRMRRRMLLLLDHFAAMGDLMDVVTHNLANTDELLHQSFDWFLLAGATDFVESETTPIGIIALVGALLLQAISIALTMENLHLRLLCALPLFAAKLAAWYLLLLFPWILENTLLALFQHHHQQQQQHPHHVASILFVGLVLAVFLLYRVVLKPIALWLSACIASMASSSPSSPPPPSPPLASTTTSKKDHDAMNLILIIYYMLCVNVVSVWNKSCGFLFTILCLPMVLDGGVLQIHLLPSPLPRPRPLRLRLRHWLWWLMVQLPLEVIYASVRVFLSSPLLVAFYLYGMFFAQLPLGSADADAGHGPQRFMMALLHSSLKYSGSFFLYAYLFAVLMPVWSTSIQFEFCCSSSISSTRTTSTTTTTTTTTTTATPKPSGSK